MYNILILYDSIFGNTEKLAKAMSKSLEGSYQVELRSVDEVFPERLDDTNFLIVGSPTRNAKPTGGLVEFLRKIPSQGLNGVKFVTFDCRLAKSELKKHFIYLSLSWFLSYAGDKISKNLALLGGIKVAPNEGFYVNSIEGPLKNGELERAEKWVKSILAQA